MLINDVLDMSQLTATGGKAQQGTLLNYISFSIILFSVVYPQASSKGLNFSKNRSGFRSIPPIWAIPPAEPNPLNLTPTRLSLHPGGRNSCDWKSFIYRPAVIIAGSGLSFRTPGSGMNEDAPERLYTPFEQADASISQKYGGTGLGMSITQTWYP